MSTITDAQFAENWASMSLDEKIDYLEGKLALSVGHRGGITSKSAAGVSVSYSITEIKSFLGYLKDKRAAQNWGRGFIPRFNYYN